MSKDVGGAYHYKHDVKNGCKLWDDCTTCPYERCQEELNKVGLPNPSRLEIIQCLNEGLMPKEVAYKFGISEATLYRRLSGDDRAANCPAHTIIFRLARRNGDLIVDRGAEYFDATSYGFEVMGKVRDRIPIDRIEE